MAKKLPKGFSVKTKRVEVGIYDMFKWAIYKDGVMVKEAYDKLPTSDEARAEGVKELWKAIDEDTI